MCLPSPWLSTQSSACNVQGGAVASGGLRDLIPAVARACIAVGLDGIFMEVGANAYWPDQREDLSPARRGTPDPQAGPQIAARLDYIQVMNLSLAGSDSNPRMAGLLLCSWQIGQGDEWDLTAGRYAGA